MIGSFAAIATGIFIGLGVFAVYAGLISSFVVFFAIEWGIGALGPWIMKRKAMQLAVKSQKSTNTILNAVRHYRQIGKELEK